MHPTKELLIKRNGLRCMACGKEYPYRELQWHHIKPKYASKAEGEEPDNSYENGALLCVLHHIKVHEYLYWQEEYQLLMELIIDNKN